MFIGARNGACVCSKPENTTITKQQNKQKNDNHNLACAAARLSWEAQVKETELPEADGCNNKTDGSRDCEQHAQLSKKVVNVVTNECTCFRVNGFASVFVFCFCLSLLSLLLFLFCIVLF